MPENANSLLAREAQKPAPLIPRVRVRALGFRNHGQRLKIGEPVKGDGLGEREQELARLEDLHCEHRFLREAIDCAFDDVGLLLEL